MTWSEYRVDYHSDKAQQHDFHRYIRAVSRADAEWRATRKWLLPSDVRLVGVTKVS